MADGWSRLRIFDKSGNFINEYDAPTKRSWVLNDVGRCEFTVPVFDPTGAARFNPKLTINNFGYGNFVLIDHKPSLNADGTTNGLLPPWVGIILPPQIWDYGKVKFTAYSAEQVLGYRPLGNTYREGVPGAIFALLLFFANSWGGIPIQPGNIDLSGVDNPITTKTDCLSQIKAYAVQTGYDWDITPLVTSGNQLILQGNWYKKKGYESGQVMSNLNLLNASPMYTEQGQLYNFVFGTNDGTTPGTRSLGLSQNITAMSQQGPLGVRITVPGTGTASNDIVQAATDAYLANISTNNFVRTFAPTVLDVGNAFSYCAVGNTWLVMNDFCGFNNLGGIGINGSIRITAVEYNDLSNSCNMAGALQ